MVRATAALVAGLDWLRVCSSSRKALGPTAGHANQGAVGGDGGGVRALALPKSCVSNTAERSAHRL